MADTDYGGFSLVTALQSNDLFLGKRGAGGINFTWETLFQNMPGYMVSGIGISTNAAQFEHGAGRTANGDAYFDLHATPGSDFESRIIRFGGTDGNFDIVNSGTGNFTIGQNNNGPLRFVTNSQERGRIDGSGNFVVGTTSALSRFDVRGGNGTGGISGPPTQVWAARIVNNQDSDGYAGLSVQTRWSNANTPIFECAQGWNGSSVGYYPVFTISGLGHTLPGSTDNAKNLGGASNRYATLYAGTGTINTSDEREKQWRGAATDAELAAARDIMGEMGFFQWLSAIDEKGEDAARWHFGVRAQRVWAIMARHGLVDPIGKDGRPGKTPYAFLCFDEWDEEFVDEMETVIRKERVPVDAASASILGANGRPARKVKYQMIEREEQVPTGRKILVCPAGNRFGVRPDQLALFLVAAQEARIAALEAQANG